MPQMFPHFAWEVSVALSVRRTLSESSCPRIIVSPHYPGLRVQDRQRPRIPRGHTRGGRRRCLPPGAGPSRSQPSAPLAGCVRLRPGNLDRHARGPAFGAPDPPRVRPSGAGAIGLRDTLEVRLSERSDPLGTADFGCSSAAGGCRTVGRKTDVITLPETASMHRHAFPT